jgi:HD superfamily phosphohydrolase YqeK
VVYLADGLEPGRGDTAELNLLRQTCHENLHKAVWLTSEFTMRSLLSSNRLIHPRAVLTRNWAMQMTHPTPPEK